MEKEAKPKNSQIKTPQIIKDIHKAINSAFQLIFAKKLAHLNNKQTIFSAFVIVDDQKNNFQILSMATGNRSLPQDKLNNMHQLIHDSHAEVLAKRAFQKFLYAQIHEFFQKQYSIFEQVNEQSKLALKKQFRVVFYSSQKPCGDCCVDPECESFQLDHGKTGAKPLSQFQLQQGQSDSIQTFQKGVLRTKPGRSDLPNNKKTNSLCCSDKIMKWNVLGVQGNLLNNYIHPIFIDFMIVETRYISSTRLLDGVQIDKRMYEINNNLTMKDLQKIIFMKDDKKIPHQFKKQQKLVMVKTQNILFQYSRDKLDEKQVPQYSDQSLIFVCKCLDKNAVIQENQIETINGLSGLKQGSNPNKIQVSNYSMLSKQSLFQDFKQLIGYFPKIKFVDNYLQMKEINIVYNLVLDNIKKAFGEWTADKRQKVDDFQMKQ